MGLYGGLLGINRSASQALIRSFPDLNLCRSSLGDHFQTRARDRHQTPRQKQTGAEEHHQTSAGSSPSEEGPFPGLRPDTAIVGEVAVRLPSAQLL